LNDRKESSDQKLFKKKLKIQEIKKTRTRPGCPAALRLRPKKRGRGPLVWTGARGVCARQLEQCRAINPNSKEE
jgi:hypothetical protein